MFSKNEIRQAIAETEANAQTYEDCVKLATFYEIQDHLYSEDAPKAINGDSDFLQAVNGKDNEAVWRVLDELMDTLKLINPHLYDGVMRKVAGV